MNFNFISKEGYKDRLPPILLKQDLNEQVWKIFRQDGKQCFARKSDFCSLENGEKLTRVYAFGDSHFAAMSPQLLSSIGNKFNYTEANLGGCPFVLNVNRYNADGQIAKDCSSDSQILRYQIIEKKPSIILVGGRFPYYLSSQRFDNKEGGVEEGKSTTFRAIDDTTFEEQFKKTIRLLISNGHQVVLVYPIPEVGVKVPQYIFETAKSRTVSEVTDVFEPLTTSYDVYKERSATTFELFDSITSPNIYRVYPHNVFCDIQIKDRCVTHDNEDVFYADDDHPSAKGSEMIVELIMKQVENAEANVRKSL